MASAAPLLSVRDVTVRFGGLHANSNISFDVPEGALFAVIGPNGAGKTTLFNVISGAFPPTEGKISLAGDDITGQPLAKNAARGLIRTYQLVQLFKDLSVAENVQVGAHRVTKGGVFAALARPGSFKTQEAEVRAEALRLLDFVGLGGRGDVQADMLDEPAAGLNTEETAALAEVIKKINATGVTVLLIEHDMSLVMKVAQRIAVLDFGKKIAEGMPDEVRRHPDVLAAYLGGTE